MEAVQSSRTRSDQAAIVATVRDYFEGWFDGDPVRMERALHKDLVKRRAGDDLGVTTKERMLELTRRGEGKEDATDRSLDIEVEDVYEGIASVTVCSAVYHE
jgi:ketosteroid isomerase-like protein